MPAIESYDRNPLTTEAPTTEAPMMPAAEPAGTAVPGLSPGHRAGGIDTLRGLAVVLVLLHHIHLRFQLNDYDVARLLPASLGTVLFWSGYYSVITFFVISGFLITTLSLRRWRSLERVPLGHFYRLRGARILPCLLLLLAVLSLLHLSGAADFTIKPERASLGRALAAALTFHLNWLEGQRGYLPGNWDVLWSLSVEETFYVLFPLMCLMLRNERWILTCMVALIVTGPLNRVALEGRDPWADYAYFSCMDGIAFGCIAAWIAARVRLSLPVVRGSMALGIVLAISIVVFRKQVSELGLTKMGLDVTALEMGVALMLLGLARGVGNTAPHRGTAWLRLAGRCSYEIYLTHMFVVLLLMHPFRGLFGAGPVASAAYGATYVVMFVLSILLGYAVQRWFSDPLNEALRGTYVRRSVGS
jgi:peptidoglycan/LPS O-acetylase OafA/YrhL